MESDEKILKTVRKHWFIIASELTASVIMLSLPFIILLVLTFIPNQGLLVSFDLSNYSKLITFSIAAWSILSLMAGFMIWTHYYLDLWIITDRRVIIVDQVHFFNRNVGSFRLERLQDIEFYVKGVIPTLLNFGTIKAQTAGAFESNFRSKGMPDPRGIQGIIQEAMDKRLANLYSKPDLAE